MSTTARRGACTRREALGGLGSAAVTAVISGSREARAPTPPSARARLIAIGGRNRGAAIAVGAAAPAQVVAA